MSIPADHRYAVATGWLAGVKEFGAPVGQSYATPQEALVRLYEIRNVSIRGWRLFHWNGVEWEWLQKDEWERVREKLECPT